MIQQHCVDFKTAILNLPRLINLVEQLGHKNYYQRT